ncbi:hypothetical protein OAO18_01035 [Francisellaceae bacterium]|nr:hypothetical protein [Francisellaceae bacterium]
MKSVPWFEDDFKKFQDLWAGKKWPHALLLTGKPGCGLEDFSHQLGRAILCENSDLTICGICRNCQLSSQEVDTHPDNDWIKPEDNIIKVEQIRHLQQQLIKKPAYGQYRVINITQAHLMNESAANALLKMLEEPNQAVYFILTSTESSLLKPTIKSRLQRYPLTMNLNQIKKWYQSQLQQTDIPFENLIKLSNGAPINMLKIQQDKSILEIRNKILEPIEHKAHFFDAVEYLVVVDQEWVIYWWLLIVTDLIRLKLNTSSPDLLANEDKKESLQAFAKVYDVSIFFATYQQLLKIKKMLSQHVNLNKQLMYEHLWLILFGEKHALEC